MAHHHTTDLQTVLLTVLFSLIAAPGVAFLSFFVGGMIPAAFLVFVVVFVPLLVCAMDRTQGAA
jgi:hypothetical protein